MNVLSAENLSKSFSERWLFKDISFGISKGQKVALVGANGTGKSTLLKVIAGKIAQDTGDIQIRKEVSVGLLLQEPELNEKLTVKECIFDDHNVISKVVRDYTEILQDPNADGDRMQHLVEEMERLHAWDFEARVGEVAAKLGISNFDQIVGTMSGGQKKRLALMQLLLSGSDFLILDEPTNHLDIDTIEWLESYLSSDNTTVLMVTHDRYFMDAVCNQVLELDRSKLYSHLGNYGYFLEKRAEREANLAQEVEKAKNLYKKELDWMRRQPKARTTKAKYREDAFEGIKDKAKTNLTKDQLQIEVKTTRQGRNVIELDHISKSYNGEEIIRDFSYVFKKKERIGIVGKNGTGKSTFLNILTGKTKADGGKRIAGQTTQFGYFKQETTDSLNGENRVIDEVKEIAEFIELGNGSKVSASKFLELFLFSPEQQYDFISKLSGGEKKRLQLLKVLVYNPNFLILDEPTNDLDIDTMNVLEEFLDNFGGCLMIVSHDRYFLDHLVDHLFLFEGNGNIKDFNGNYSDYQEYLKVKKRKDENAKTSAKKVKESNPRVKLDTKASYNEQKEYDGLEAEIAKLETEKENLIAQLNSGETDHSKLAEWSVEVEKLSASIDTKTERWIELSEICA